MLDLKTVAEETATDDTPVDVVITDRNGKAYGDEPVVFQVVGEYSKHYREQERKIYARVRSDVRRGVETAADEDRFAAEKIAAGVVGWRGPIAAPFSFENAVEILLAAPWIADKVARAIKRHSDFFVNASAN